MQNIKKIDETKTGHVQLMETDNPLDIRYDHIFKAVFTKDTPASKGALSGLISALIGRKVIVETIMANEPPIINDSDRRIRFDIACKALSGELVNIEMSFNPGLNELAKIEYYASRQFSGQDIQGKDKDYADLVETFQIAIVDKEVFFPDEALVHTFLYYDPIHRISFKGKTRIIMVELLKTDGLIDKPIHEMDSSEKWSVFFQYLTNKEKRATINEILEREEEIAMAGETLIHISRNEIEQARLTSELKYVLDMQDARVSFERKGRVEGREEGMKEGRYERNTEIARNLLAKGSTPEFVHEITGLPLETIIKIQTSM